MAKSPYARKEWLRKHSTSKEMRWLNNGIDAAVKGIGSGRKSIQAPGSTQEDWSRTALSKGQLRAAIIIGAILPLFGIAGLEGQEPGGAFFFWPSFFCLCCRSFWLFWFLCCLISPRAPERAVNLRRSPQIQNWTMGQILQMKRSTPRSRNGWGKWSLLTPVQMPECWPLNF